MATLLPLSLGDKDIARAAGGCFAGQRMTEQNCMAMHMHAVESWSQMRTYLITISERNAVGSRFYLVIHFDPVVVLCIVLK